MFPEWIPMVRPILPDAAEIDAALRKMLASGMVTKGPHLMMLEELAAEHLGVKHAVAVSSCTLGLMLTYRGLGLDGWQAIVPSFTFMATVSAMHWSGVKPVFVDVSPDTTNIDVNAVEAAITPGTKAVVAVHNFGCPAPIDDLQKVCSAHGLRLVFDAAHGLGARYRGDPVGRQGDAQVFSLSPTKLAVAGEGGIVATNDDALAKYVRIGREYGNPGNYDSLFAGLNARMPEFSAMLGCWSLGKIEAAVERRNALASLCMEKLSGLPGISFQKVADLDRHSYKELSFVVDETEFGISRSELVEALRRENIDTRTYYDPPVHRHTAYRHEARMSDLGVTDWLAARSVSLPIWSGMELSCMARISDAIVRTWEHRDAVRSAIATPAPQIVDRRDRDPQAADRSGSNSSKRVA